MAQLGCWGRAGRNTARSYMTPSRCHAVYLARHRNLDATLRAPKVHGYTSPGHRRGFWEAALKVYGSIGLLGPGRPEYRTILHDTFAVPCGVPGQAQEPGCHFARAEGARLYQPRPSAWVLGSRPEGVWLNWAF